MPPLPTVHDKTGRPVPLGNLLGRGGEAAVYEVTDGRGLVAKLYHKPPPPTKAEKLLAMSAIATDRLLALSAWPVSTLHNGMNALPVGVLMRNVSGFKDVHFLYNPKSRFREFPRANWPYLLHVGSNVARAFSVFHEHGVVIGDVNQSNVRVSPDSGIVTLIDCDSFQIKAGGNCYVCEVGVPTYTPPELQEKNFGSIVRTPNHDNFGLAVMLFHLLFMGRHPFAGRFLGKGDMPIEKAIGEFRFPFASDATARQMQPPPNSLSLADVSPQIATMMQQAFSPIGVNNGRPAAKEWVQALDQFKADLRQCTNNSAHHFYRALAKCPWCAIEGHSGIVFFVGLVYQPTATGFNIEAFWRELSALPAPGPAPDVPLPTAASFNIAPSPAARRIRRRHRWRIAATALVVIVGLFALVADGSAGGVWLFLMCIAISVVIVKIGSKERQPFESAYRTAQAQFRAVQDRWTRETGDQRFTAKLSDMKRVHAEYVLLPATRLNKLQELEKNRYNSQLRRFLERHSIQSADIPTIGPGRKAMLISFGIDSADDVTDSAVMNVPGFGPAFTARLLDWRRSVERRFVFKPNEPVDPEEIKRVEQEIGDKRRKLEQAITIGGVELKRIHAQINAARQAISAEAASAYEHLLRAEVEYRATG